MATAMLDFLISRLSDEREGSEIDLNTDKTDSNWVMNAIDAMFSTPSETMNRAKLRFRSWVPSAIFLLVVVGLRLLIAVATTANMPSITDIGFSPRICVFHFSVAAIDSWVYASRPYGGPLTAQFWSENLWTKTKRLSRNLCRPRIHAGHQRIEWTCVRLPGWVPH